MNINIRFALIMLLGVWIGFMFGYSLEIHKITYINGKILIPPGTYEIIGEK